MKNEEFLCRTLDFGEFLLLLASHQTEEQDDYDELNFAFQLFDIGIGFNIFF
jgi:Ca2+-binding EF-hand superfamily protein